MAIVADIAAGNMLKVFAGCTDIVVTETAYHGRAFELSGYVAFGAINNFVSSD